MTTTTSSRRRRWYVLGVAPDGEPTGVAGPFTLSDAQRHGDHDELALVVNTAGWAATTKDGHQ